MYTCAYTASVSYQWDPKKAAANVDKHGVDFADAIGALEDPLAITIDAPDPAEDRYLTIGMDLVARVVVVCWTSREDEIRLISARPANKRERGQYEQKR